MKRDEAIRKRLREMADPVYGQFQGKLMPEISPQVILGVRIPALRAYAKELAGTKEGEEFLTHLPHGYYEENNLHGFLIAEEKIYEKALKETETFLPYVDNWATCDSFSPKAFAGSLEALLPKTLEWMASSATYTIRFGIGMQMRFFLQERFSPEYLKVICAIKSEEYYVNMMRAWYLATALFFQPEETEAVFLAGTLDLWTHNKGLQKALESRRFTPEEKDGFRRMKRKK